MDGLHRTQLSLSVDKYTFEPALSRAQFLKELAHNPSLGLSLSQGMAHSRFSAFFFETPPFSLASGHRAMEFVLVDAPPLAGIVPDANAFAGYFTDKAMAVAFDNLGGDAHLIAPCPEPQVRTQVYSSLASFVKQAPKPQQIFFWQLTGQKCLERLAPAPFWLSTSGLGVYFLHMRLDKRPKYYQYEAYRHIKA